MGNERFPDCHPARQSHSHLGSIILTLLVTFACGCHSIRPKSSSDFIAPLASQNMQAWPTNQAPKSERELCIRTAATVAAQGHVTEAIALYEQAEKLASGASPLNRELAPLYSQAGRMDEAISRYQRAIAETPHDAALLNNFAWTLLEANRARQAIEVVGEGLQRWPHDRRLQATHAVALYRGGDRASALALFTSLHGPSAAHHNIALLDVEFGDQSQASVEVKRALTYDPDPQTLRLATAIENL